MKFIMLSNLALASAVTLMSVTAPASAKTGEQILEEKCSSCHNARPDGSYERIHDGRRTPEGWSMTIIRMMRNHDVSLTDPERRTITKYLADTNGLTVEETEGYRYILEKNPVAWDEGVSKNLTEICSRCHSYARVALQRRTPDDWKKLIHFHIGQFPTMEYQALARDRDWWAIAHGPTVEELSKLYPLGKAPEMSKVDMSGTWRLTGHQPGAGDYDGYMTVKALKDGKYSVQKTLSFANGTSADFLGNAILYGAGEWRASLKNGDQNLRQVLSLNKDKTLIGRWFESQNDVVGGTLIMVKAEGPTQLLSVSPSFAKIGTTTRVSIAGVDLEGIPHFGEGVSVKVVSSAKDAFVVDVTVAADAAVGEHDVNLGKNTLKAGFIVYDKVNTVKVVPPVTFARVGGNGGAIAKVPAQFEAVGYMNGEDGKAGTDDDIRIGAMEAEWKTDNFDDVAAALEDAKFVGQISSNGLFTPADAGPNPERPKMTNNAGNLSITAQVKDGQTVVEGKGQLYVTVQRFVDPPIR